MLRFYGRGFIALIAVLIATPVLSQAANFDTLTLSAGFPKQKGTAAGYTGGSFSLPSIANSDRNNKPCLGFGGSKTPDYIINLETDFPNLKVAVNSGNKDTTLVMRGPNNLILCGDDTGSSKDASVEATNLKAGKYEIWVGTIEAGKNWNYTLTVTE